MHRRRPTWPSPTTTTWSERGTARRPSRPVRLRPISRSTSPPVNAAANSSATSIESEIVELEPLRAVLHLGVRVDRDERLDRAVERVDRRSGRARARPRPSRRSGSASSPTAPKNTSAALRSNGSRIAVASARTRARPDLRERDLLHLAVAEAQAVRPVAVEQRRDVVVEARPGERRRDDVGERRDRDVLDLLLELAAGRGVEDRGDDRDLRVEVADEQRRAQRPGVVARDDGDARRRRARARRCSSSAAGSSSRATSAPAASSASPVSSVRSPAPSRRIRGAGMQADLPAVDGSMRELRASCPPWDCSRT